MNKNTSLTPSRLAHRIKAWAEKMYITFSNSAWREKFRFILKSDVEGRRVGLSLLDSTFSGWSINHAENGLKCVKVTENEEGAEVMSLGADALTLSVPMKGVDGEGKDCLATQQYVDDHSSSPVHLYAHVVTCCVSTAYSGEVNFIIYDNSPDKKYTIQSKIAEFLFNNTFGSPMRFYPVAGVTQQGNNIRGMFATNLSYVLLLHGTRNTDALTPYMNVVAEVVIQIF